MLEELEEDEELEDELEELLDEDEELDSHRQLRRWHLPHFCCAQRQE